MHRGKPAFPGVRLDDDGKVKHEPGMTLRDYWATEILKMLFPEYVKDQSVSGLELCKSAYKMADLMAIARDHDA